MKKNNYFMASLFLILIAANVFAPNYEAALKIAGILFACSYVLFYASDITVFYYRLLAWKAIRNNDPDIVKQYYRQICLVSPHSLSGKASRAVIHTLDGEWESAAALYREVLRERPHDFLLQYNMAVTLVRMGQYDEAMKTLVLIIHLRPAFALAYSALGEIEVARGNDETAYRYFCCALLLDQSDASARLHLPGLKAKLEQAA